MIEDGKPTPTSLEQIALERRVADLYSDLQEAPLQDLEIGLILMRSKHVSYLHDGLHTLPAGFISLDASRPWICYWIVHSLALLQAPLPNTMSPGKSCIFLGHCQHREGGFGGGPGQLAHLAPTYAAVGTLVTLGGEQALASVNRQAVASFIAQMAVRPGDGRLGGFTVCEGGEVDVRGCYCAMAAAHMLGLDKQALAAQAGMVQYLQACQTYEGGMGGEPGNEAHGGYAFCAVAALALIGRAGELDLRRLVHWAAHRQGSFEGGFMGRTNKLVDGCYSFWQGGLYPILQTLMPEYLQQCSIPCMPAAQVQAAADQMEQGRDSAGGAAGPGLLCNPVALQLWLLRCCQGDRGGFKDKPGKPPDYYHTCYCLSGLSAVQHMGGHVLGPKSNLLVRTDPLCNVVTARLDAALIYNSRIAART
eukprot:jgi/Astpho2/4559/e_gw1.00067.409.1_t